jgi:hypothetical protein
LLAAQVALVLLLHQAQAVVAVAQVVLELQLLSLLVVLSP